MPPSRLQVSTLAAAAFFGCGCQARARRTPDDTLVVLVEARLTSLDPRYCESNHDVKLSQLVAPGLTSVEQQSMEPRLLLADKIVKRDDRTFDVTLKPGFRFSDGTPVTADDVAFTYMSVLDPAMKSQDLRAFQERFVSVEALDTLTARFHLVAPLATFESDIAFGGTSSTPTRNARCIPSETAVKR